MNGRNSWALAVIAGLLIGPAASAAEPAAGADSDVAREIEDRAISEAHRDRAREANEHAAREAIESIGAGNRLDLDIRLIGPTSTKIAGDRQVTR